MDRSPSREFETIKEIVAVGTDRDRDALDVRTRATPYSYSDFCTGVWKAGNLFCHYGVHSIGELAVSIGPKSDGGEGSTGILDAAEPLLAVLGGIVLGATVDVTPESPVDAPAFVYPASRETFETTPECSRIAYGGPPEDHDVAHFERDAWSENPIEPPERVFPDDPALRVDGETYTHSTLLRATRDVVSEYELGESDSVVLTGALSDVGGFVAGVLTPLSIGGTIVVPESDDVDPTSMQGNTLVVADGDAGIGEYSGNRVVHTGDLTRSLRDTRRT